MSQLPCNIAISNYICPSNKKIIGRACPFVSVVLVPLGMTYDGFIPQTLFPYINEAFSPIPISVHYAVSQKGEIAQFIDSADTAFGLRAYSNPSFPLRPIPTPATREQLNCPFIYIGVEIPTRSGDAVELCPQVFELTEFQQNQIAKLICCLGKQYNFTPSVATITDAYSLDTRLDSYLITQEFIGKCFDASTNDCGVLDEPILCPPTPVVPCDTDCVDCNDDDCCPLHKARIAVLQNSLNALNNVVSELQTQVGGQTAIINGLNVQIADVNSHYQQILDKFDAIEDCFNCLCPQQTQFQRIEYELSGSENAQQLVPLAPTKLKMPIQISDKTPAVVNSSSYFIAQLTDGCNYIVQLSLTLETSTYFNGSEVWVDMVSCNGRTKIASQIVTGDGVVSLFGQTNLQQSVSPCNVYFEVFTNDNKDGGRKIEYASVRITCS